MLLTLDCYRIEDSFCDDSREEVIIEDLNLLEEEGYQVLYECHCKELFAQQQDLTEHLKTHEVRNVSLFAQEQGFAENLNTHEVRDVSLFAQEEGLAENLNTHEVSNMSLFAQEQGLAENLNANEVRTVSLELRGVQFVEEEYICGFCLRPGSASVCVYCLELHRGKHPPIDPNVQQCDACEMWFCSAEVLNSHKEWAHLGTRYACDVCHKQFSNVNYVLTHKAKVHDSNYEKELFYCSFCSKEFFTKKKQYRHHVLSHIDPTSGNFDNIFLCEECGAACFNENKLRQHKLIHKNKNLECKQCGKKFRLQSSLGRHIFRYTRKQMYICVECQDVFNTDPELFRHCEETGHEQPRETQRRVEPKVQCDFCHEWFASKGSLQAHIDFAHFGKTWPCEYCDRKFGSKNSYTAHIATHKPDYVKPTFSCAYCSKVFLAKKSLHSHLESHHTQEQAGDCDICGKKFPTAGRLKVHKLHMHSDYKPFVCEDCGKGFAARSMLVGHKTTHRFDTTHCEMCGKEYSTIKLLRNHIGKHHPELKPARSEEEYPIVCMKCTKRFRTKKNLGDHLRRSHCATKITNIQCGKCSEIFKSLLEMQNHDCVDSDSQ